VARVVWTALARRDLRQIRAFIARDSKDHARLTERRIRDATRRLARFPGSGRIVPEFPDEGFREVIVGSYRAIYHFDNEANRVLVVAVLHASRRLPTTLTDV
jgi:toxin ParE1/3/4